MSRHNPRAVSTSAAAVVAIVLLVVGVGAGYFAGQGAAAPTTVTRTQTVAGAATTITQTVTGPATTVTRTVTVQQLLAISKLKVGLILPITEEDRSWNGAAFKAATKLKEQYGFELTIARNLFDGTKAEPTAVQWAQQGFNVIIGQGIQYMDLFAKIGPRFPNTLFVCIDCFRTDTPNVYPVWLTLEESGYLMGLLAGKISKTGKVGIVGGGRVPSIWAGHEGFKRGAKEAGVQVTNIFEAYLPLSWADVAGAKRAVEQMADQGVDVVWSSGDGIDVGTRQAAKEKNIKIMTMYEDAIDVDPARVLANAVFRWEIAYQAALFDYVRNDFKGKWFQMDVFGGGINVQLNSANVPADVVKFIVEKQQSLRLAHALPFRIDPACFDKPDRPECKP